MGLLLKIYTGGQSTRILLGHTHGRSPAVSPSGYAHDKGSVSTCFLGGDAK